MECANECNEFEEIEVENEILKTGKICRGYDFYVDSSSIEPAELGTIQYPYKEINSAIFEILNFHTTHQNVVTIHIMEGTTVYLNSPTYIINIKNLIFKSYSGVKSTPDKARIVGIPSSVTPELSLSPTKFHLLGNLTS